MHGYMLKGQGYSQAIIESLLCQGSDGNATSPSCSQDNKSKYL